MFTALSLIFKVILPQIYVKYSLTPCKLVVAVKLYNLYYKMEIQSVESDSNNGFTHLTVNTALG